MSPVNRGKNRPYVKEGAVLRFYSYAAGNQMGSKREAIERLLSAARWSDTWRALDRFAETDAWRERLHLFLEPLDGLARRRFARLVQAGICPDDLANAVGIIAEGVSSSSTARAHSSQLKIERARTLNELRRATELLRRCADQCHGFRQPLTSIMGDVTAVCKALEEVMAGASGRTTSSPRWLQLTAELFRTFDAMTGRTCERDVEDIVNAVRVARNQEPLAIGTLGRAHRRHLARLKANPGEVPAPMRFLTSQWVLVNYDKSQSSPPSRFRPVIRRDDDDDPED